MRETWRCSVYLFDGANLKQKVYTNKICQSIFFVFFVFIFYKHHNYLINNRLRRKKYFYFNMFFRAKIVSTFPKEH